MSTSDTPKPLKKVKTLKVIQSKVESNDILNNPVIKKTRAKKLVIVSESDISLTSNNDIVITSQDALIQAQAVKLASPISDNSNIKPDFLSPEAIQAMPESEYMCAAQLRYFRSVLETMRQDILINSNSTAEHLRENVVVPDPADRATIEEEHAIELRTRDRERKLLKKIAQALDAIEHGEYGWCEETGDAIGIRRLLARPTATLSLEAQERREKKQKMFGH